MRQDRLSLSCLSATLVVVLGVVGCSEDTDGAGASGTTPNPPTGTSGQDDTTSAGSESVSSGDGICTDSTMCGSGWYCAAQHTAGQTAPPEEGICMDECVPLEHVSLWCLDDAACCEGTCDEASGFCVAEGGTDSDTATDTTGATATGSSSEPGTASSTTTDTETSASGITTTDTGTSTSGVTTTATTTSSTGTATTTP